MLGALVLWPRTEAPTHAAPLIAYEVVPPGKASLRLDTRPALAISPDGSAIVFAATENGATRLYIRRRGDTEIRPLPGTEGGSDPVFSPDGKSLAFVGSTNLMRMPLDGRPIALAPVNDTRGIAWADNSQIVVAPDTATGLSIVPATGGAAKTLTTLDTTSDDRTHRWPAPVPGGKAILFTVGKLSSPDNYDEARIDAVVIATGERRKVMDGASFVRVGPGGLLFYAKAGTVYAVPFDSERLVPTGTGVPVLQSVATDTTTGAAYFAAEPGGTLTYVQGGTSTVDRQVVWADRNGAVTPIAALPPGLYNDIRVSPDGNRLAILEGSSGSGDIALYDIRSTAFTRLTLDHKNATPVWSRDSKSVYYASTESTGKLTTIFKRPIDGSQEAVALVSVKTRAYLDAIDPSEKTGYLTHYDPQTFAGVDLMSVPLSGGTPTLLAGGKFNQSQAAVSSDGRWLAYQTDEGGRYAITVRDLQTGSRWPVPTPGGEEPHWSRDGTELFYRADTQFMSIKVTTTPEFRSNPPTVLFDGIYNLRSDTGVTYDLDHKTGRFAMLRPAGQMPGAPAPRVRMLVNWLENFRQGQSSQTPGR